MADLVFEAPAVKKKTPIHLADLNLAERKERAVELGLPAFRANQLAVHFFTHHNDDVESFTDIPKELRTTIGDAFLPKLLTLVRSVTCDGGRTRKDLWRLHDGVLVESVLMGYTDRTTVCISSQAGCGMQCPFCATGQAGLTRNLTAGEITAQVVMAARACDLGELPGGPTRLSNVVFMGMGEPMANYKAVMQSIRNITNPQPDGLGIGARSVTLSTVGLVTGIEKLIEEGLMTKAGFESIEIAKQNGSWILLDEVEELLMPEELKKAFERFEGSEDFFTSLSKSKRKQLLHWVISAKRAETKEKRCLEIAELAGKKLRPKQF